MYDVYVAAETSAGIGPKSNISVFTPPDGKDTSFSVFMRSLLHRLNIILEAIWFVFA